MSSVNLSISLTEKKFSYDEAHCSSPKEVAELMNSFIGDLVREQECFLLLTLTTSLSPIALRLVHLGNKSSCNVDPGTIFKHAILDNATALIVGHNHPSGEVEPSAGDIEITKKLKEAGDLIGVELLDHIVFGDRSAVGLKFTSMKRAGLL